ncbi:MAG: NfeD family protein [Parachlamydiaceae bacterium]|nr:NfeD family protein [Parachlamydiaceae bacterium]
MSFFLVLLGLILIVIEFYVPGGIVAILGIISILTGLTIFGLNTTSIWAFSLFLAGTIIGIIMAIRFALWRIVKAKPGYSIYSNDDQEGFFASSYDKTAIGKTGIVLSDLKPGGFISIDGHRHPAISLSGYLSKGEEVVVVSGQEQSLMVKSKSLFSNSETGSI